MTSKYTSIRIKKQEYDGIAERKSSYERSTGLHFDWGTWLEVMTGVRSICEFVPKTDSERIEETVVCFWSAYEHREFDFCLDCLSQRLRAAEGDENLLARLSASRATSGESYLRKHGRPELSPAGSTAVMLVDLLFVNSGLQQVRLSLVKEGSEWRIDEYPCH